MDKLKPSVVHKAIKPTMNAGAKIQRSAIRNNITGLDISNIEKKQLKAANKTRSKVYGNDGVVGRITGIQFKREATGETTEEGKKEYAERVTVKSEGQKVTVSARDVVLLGHRLELGTAKTKKQPFVRTGFEQTRNTVLKVLKDDNF